MKADHTFIVIPAHNEEKHIGEVLEKAKKLGFAILVVDDGSKDNTSKIVKEKKCELLRHKINLGKGAALKTGCDYAIKKGAEILIVMDADGQHKPEDVPRFLDALKGVDIVFGYRKLNKNMPFIMRFGNGLINAFARLLFGVKIKDTQSGFRAMKKEAYQKIKWESKDYSMEMEMIARVGKYRITYKEIPIETIYHDKYKGTTIFDGMKIVVNMIAWKMRGK